MSSPVDIKAVFDAMGDAEEARSKPLRVHVYLDDSAPVDLANIALAATRTGNPNATILHDAYPAATSIPDASSDLAVVVAHESRDTGRLYRNLQGVGVPVVVLCVNREEVARIAIDAGAPISGADIIAPRSSEDARALADRSADSAILLDSTDARSMLDDLAQWMLGVYQDLRLAFAYTFPYVRKPLALESVNATAVQNAGIGVVAIIPGADMPLMTLNQVKMLLEIAAAYGEDLTLARLKEILAIVGGAFAMRTAARQVVGLVPGVGWAVKGGIGYAGTIAMGHALLEYFESGADVAETAQNAADTIRRLPNWLGLSKEKGIGDNIRIVSGAVAEAASSAAGSVARNIGPAAASIAASAGKATGFSKDDLASFASKLGDGLKGKLKG